MKYKRLSVARIGSSYTFLWDTTGNNNPETRNSWPSLREGIEASIETASTPLEAKELREFKEIAIKHNWDFDSLDDEFPS